MRPLVAIVALACGVALAPGRGFRIACQEPGEKARIALDVIRVDILCTVTDKRGRFITGLTKKDFEVMEGAHPQNILGFTAQTDLPLRLAVVLDTSNSVRERFHFIQEAAIDFVGAVLRPRVDRVMVLSFDTSVEQVAEFNDQLSALASAIRDLRPGRGTCLYDGIYSACRDKLAAEKPRYGLRRAVVLLSDGEDNQSHATRDQALEMAQKSDVVIYAVSTNTTRLETHGDKVLKYFAQETGGLAFFPFRTEDLGKSFESLAKEIRHQYNIYYRPEPLRTDGQFHAIKLQVKGRKDLVVRVRKGYYAPKL